MHRCYLSVQLLSDLISTRNRKDVRGKTETSGIMAHSQFFDPEEPAIQGKETFAIVVATSGKPKLENTVLRGKET